jgi:mono/diheme cytochrome c family protein
VRQFLPIVSGVALAASLAAASHKPRSEEGPAAQLSKAPLFARSLVNPFAGQAEAAAAGRKLYKEHCAECHGADARGLEHAANLRSPTIQSAPPGVLYWALRNGRIRKGMPSWSRLPDQQLWQLVTYVQSLAPEAHTQKGGDVK